MNSSIGNQERSGYGITRRSFLQSGSLGLVGLSAANALALPRTQAAQTSAEGLPGFGRAKSVVVLYLYGAPSQMDTLDPKPDAPSETRGEFKTIPSSLPGIPVCEHLPRIAKNLHRVALIRSMTHSSNNHSVSVALSGLPRSEPVIEANGKDDRHWPYFGSVLEFLWKRQGLDAASTGIPVNLILPWTLNAKSDPRRWSPHAAWLGRAYNPVIPQFVGRGSREVGNPANVGGQAGFSRFDPYDGLTPESTFRFEGTDLPEDISTSRLMARRQLLKKLDAEGGELVGSSSEAFDRYREVAFNMITDPKVAEAVDVTREPPRVREQYGLTLFAQEALAARRLVEAGVKVVTAFWDDYSNGNQAWDTHNNHFPRLKGGLCPIFDRVLPAFLDDMEQRGLLEKTLVMVISEHGRTPTINKSPGGGRDHWSGAYWGMFFGAGIKTGQVIGATDKQGGYPISDPIDPKDILATMYHLLGFDALQTAIPDRLERPIHLLPYGKVVRELLA
ncbi:MAG: DUF1501 domain-containing protein [Planctomycetes bacterium]|nr:DUF1501 domain-containing protein [Planctomycetota bacterium]